MIDSLITIAFVLSSALTVVILLLPSQYVPPRSSTGQAEKEKPTVQILVLGDIGRSPRMQYHALSIARNGGKVVIIGYKESDPHPDIVSNPNITIVPLRPHPAILQTSNKLLFMMFGPLKVLFQVACLWQCLAYTTAPARWIIVQNPPSIPTLAVTSVSCFLRQTRLIIDWHNFGYSILALKLGDTHPLVKLSTWYEKTFGRSASAHLCVTDAMGRVLKKDFQLQAPILSLHDRPASHFNPITSSNERTEFLTTLPETGSVRPLLKSGAVRVLVSSTSWTADEDFSVLIEALVKYSELAVAQPHLPDILAIITGKGPQKEMYLKQIATLEAAGKLQRVTIRTAWLTVPDYARLLASASLGVSLHNSSSGVDLPMKVVDMFGAGLPVVGWSRFEAWPELVTEGVNGMGFGSSGELTDQLVELFGDNQKLDRLRAGAQKESLRRWDDEWDPIAGALLGLT
ncbi:Chitobiosyldiphosphodolichol beta-mannosyltransferase [Penicillium subrubescens]|uniref:Chitobiosyldiphosphodolichol beta-mannosyltransferase n=1 Tax=Penicillium subrubescens TaxID=1316194 RepID=A0A1Q5SQV8_9EURO|nr:Chitobiosyldiphosphodolichol beta-mannosyltransferase [Penicillium subrubescens]KAJ5905001.1 Chitobiosyldiphosphodolichol beta-mannosyltransferase [Penicillium subrubescens]OKO90352.1 Chitobiosyldiphosphodolichol beta-mannosyltransferase [Penicillium subrubescens]